MSKLLVIIALTLSLTGCLAYGEGMAKLYGLDCSYPTLQQNNGRCLPTSVQKGN